MDDDDDTTDLAIEEEIRAELAEQDSEDLDRDREVQHALQAQQDKELEAWEGWLGREGL